MMKRTIGNFTTQAEQYFPVDAETFASMEENISLVQIIGNLAGDKAVLRGCELREDGTTRAPGYVFLRTEEFPDGEVLYFEGGAVASGMYLNASAVAVSSGGVDFPRAYTVRCLSPGIGGENFKWEDFHEADTLPELRAELSALETAFQKIQPQPVGSVQLFAGENVPDGWLLCNGAQYAQKDYPELYAAVGAAFNRAMSENGVAYTTTAGYFRVPDLRGRFVVGRSDSDDDYNALGAAGGKKNVTLTAEESGLPLHTHTFTWISITNSAPTKAREENSRMARGNTGALSAAKETEAAGGWDASNSHENRPPYYTLTYIIKAR